MRIISAFAVAAATLLISGTAGAATLYSNNFDTENGGAGATLLNIGTVSGNLTGLTVSVGSVDLVKTPDYGITCAGGSGSCIDLDGTTVPGPAGRIETGFYNFNAGDSVTFTFDLSGNQRVGGFDDFVSGFKFGANTLISSYNLGGAYGASTPFSNILSSGFATSTSTSGNTFKTYSINFVAGQAGIVSAFVADPNKNSDYFGAIVDNVTLTNGAVPEPATWAMMIIGFGAAGSMIRRRKAALAA